MKAKNHRKEKAKGLGEGGRVDGERNEEHSACSWMSVVPNVMLSECKNARAGTG